MHTMRFWPRLAAVVAGSVLSGGCLLIPEIEDKIVELATSGSTTVEFVSSGEVNSIDDLQTVDVRAGLDLAQILADAGIDVSDVTHIALSGVAYRITVADPDAGREIVDGTITIDRGGSGPLTLVSSFNAAAGAVTDWQTVTLNAGGLAVAEINDLLGDLLEELQGGPPANTTLTYHVTGASLPADVPTNFTWELRVTVSITGNVEVSVPQ